MTKNKPKPRRVKKVVLGNAGNGVKEPWDLTLTPDRLGQILANYYNGVLLGISRPWKCEIDRKTLNVRFSSPPSTHKKAPHGH